MQPTRLLKRKAKDGENSKTFHKEFHQDPACEVNNSVKKVKPGEQEATDFLGIFSPFHRLLFFL
jgi:hypothetical protein